MSVDILKQKKQEVAESMVKDFRNELNFFQSTILSFFEKKITQTIISDATLGDSLEEVKPRMNFFEKMLVKLSPSAAEKVFLFIKEKQEQLVKAKTVEELEDLKKGIIVPEVKPENQPEADVDNIQQAPKDQDVQENKEGQEANTDYTNIATGVGVGGGLGVSAIAADKMFKLQQKNKIKSSISIEDPKGFAQRLKSQFEELGNELAKDAKNPKLHAIQKKMMEKSAKEFDIVAKNLDKDTFTAIDMLYKLEKKLPKSLLKSIDPEDGAKLAKLISTDTDFVATLSKKATTVDEIQDILKTKGIQNINKEVAQAMKAMKGADELKGFTHVLTNMKGIKAVMRGVKGIAFLDLISTGFDVWLLTEGLDEAEAYEKLNALRSSTQRERQRVQFGTQVALTAVSIIASFTIAGSAGGPIGMAVGAILGAASFAVSQAVDVYYDKVEFYLQNQEDFKRQYRTELKQAILQSAASEEWNLNRNQRLDASAQAAGTSWAKRNLLPFGILFADKKALTTTEDARKVLVRQEEYEAFPLIQNGFLSGKTEEEYTKSLDAQEQEDYKTQKQSLNAIVDKRMAYIKKHMYQNTGTPEHKAFVAAMKNGMGIKAIEKITADSKLQYQIEQTGPDQYILGAKTMEEYKQAFKEKLSTESPQGFAALETLWGLTPYAVLELGQGVKNFSEIFANVKTDPEYEHKEHIPTIEKNMEIVKRYIEYKYLGLPIEEQKKLEISLRAIDVPMLEKVLVSGDFAKIGAIVFTPEEAKSYFTRDWVLERQSVHLEVSTSTGQNIIYRIAKEMHGYVGRNDRKELIDFFSGDKGSSLGLYYSNGRKINNDWAVDKSIDIDAMDTMSADEIMETWVQPAQINHIFRLIDPVEIGKVAIFGPAGLLLPGSLFGFVDDASWLDTKAEAGDMDKKMNKEFWGRLRKIVREEKAYAFPAVKNIIEAGIVAYIKNNIGANQTGYIELPYYMVMAAKRAKMGNLENFLWTYKDGKLVAACSLVINMKETISFPNVQVEKQQVAGIEIDQEEYGEGMQYIQYVDSAKNKFQELITFNDNDLDLPKEYLDAYNAKILERYTFKTKLLSMEKTVAKSTLLEKYQEYHDRFDHMYTAMLLEISKFRRRSNDLDSAEYLRAVENMAEQLGSIHIENGIIVGTTEVFSDNQRKIFYTVVQERKPRNKSIIDLAKSKNPDEQTKAIWAVKQVVKSMIEAQVVYFDKQGNISKIVHGRDKGFEYTMLDQEPMRWKQIRDIVVQRLAVNGNPSNYFVPPQLD